MIEKLLEFVIKFKEIAWLISFVTDVRILGSLRRPSRGVRLALNAIGTADAVKIVRFTTVVPTGNVESRRQNLSLTKKRTIFVVISMPIL